MGREALLYSYEFQGSPYAKFDIRLTPRYTVKNSERPSYMERGQFMGWFVYILRCGDGSLYTGYTNDVPRRLMLHQNGQGAKYTRSRPPVSLAYQEELPDKSAALRREAAIKRMKRPQKLSLIASAQP